MTPDAKKPDAKKPDAKKATKSGGKKADMSKQPLYIPPEERVSLEQIKHRAETIQNMAVVQAKEVANEVYEQNVTRAVLVAVGVVVVAASLAYFMGRRAASRAFGDTPPPA